MRKNVFRFALSIVVVICFGFLVAHLPIFKVQTVTIVGNETIPSSTIEEQSGAKDAVSIFAYSIRKSSRLLQENPYIESAVVTKQLPHTVTIEVKERKVRGYVEYMGTFLYLDKEGRVLEASPSFVDNLPVVVGLSFQDFTIGNILQVENQGSFNTMVELSNLFTKYNLSEDIVRVDVTDENNIHLYIYNIDVEFGSILEADEKMRTLRETLKTIPDYKTVKSFINITNPSQAIFGLLT